MNRALLWKEWREQRWRGLLGTAVLATLAASLVRAQLVTLPETIFLLWGPLGLLLAVFYAMGSVATERADGTWDFLRARPVGPACILRSKWLVGAVFLVVGFVVAGAAAHWAAWTRNLFNLTPPPPQYWAASRPGTLLPGTQAGSMWLAIFITLAAMLAWYTVLFFVLTRARSELHAGLGGLLLTIAALAWLLQYGMARATDWLSAPLRSVFWVSVEINPLSPALCLLGESADTALLTAGGVLLLWVAGPLWLIGRLERTGRLT